MTDRLKTGERAPPFSAAATGGADVSLDDCRGKFIVLFFYPKDATSG